MWRIRVVSRLSTSDRYLIPTPVSVVHFDCVFLTVDARPRHHTDWSRHRAEVRELHDRMLSQVRKESEIVYEEMADRIELSRELV